MISKCNNILQRGDITFFLFHSSNCLSRKSVLQRLLSVLAFVGFAFGTNQIKSKTAQNILAENKQIVVKITTDHGTGTGFYINQHGTVLTCYHVIKDAKKISIKRVNSSGNNKLNFLQPTIIWKDENRDQALIQTYETNTPYAKISLQSKPPKELDELILLGYPLGVESINANIGRVSAVYKNSSIGTIYQSDVTMNPGHSGGPMLDSNGHVVAMATAKIDSQKIPNVQGMNIAYGISSTLDEKFPYFESIFEELLQSDKKAHYVNGDIQIGTSANSKVNNIIQDIRYVEILALASQNLVAGLYHGRNRLLGSNFNWVAAGHVGANPCADLSANPYADLVEKNSIENDGSIGKDSVDYFTFFYNLKGLRGKVKDLIVKEFAHQRKC